MAYLAERAVCFQKRARRAKRSRSPSLTSVSGAALALAVACASTTAMAQQATATASQAEPARSQEPSVQTDDIVVTASKRSESVRSVSGSVSALSGDQLTEQGAQSFKDYLAGLPGVQFQQATPGVSNVTMRGIGVATVNPDQGQATTGIYINDVPVTDPGFAMAIPDLDTFDVQRVEVLKGPQGTLYGAATLGGAVNYIYNPVSLNEVQAAAQSGVSATQGGGSFGYAAKAAINIPIVNDVFGIRIAGVSRSDPGYLDNIGTGTKNSNTHTVSAIRLNSLLKISDSVKLSYFFLYDRARNGDGFFGMPNLGNLVRRTAVNETATFVNRINNAKLDADFGFASLVVSLADVYKTQTSIGDVSPFYTESVYSASSPAKSHSQIAEARLTSPGGATLDWLVGIYLADTTEIYPASSFSLDGTLQDGYAVSYRNKERAIFGEATYHLSDTLKVTGGGRYYNIDLRTQIGFFAPGTDPSSTNGKAKNNGFSPKASLTYTPSRDVMLYALASRGFRSGGVNLNPPIASFPTPATYGSDSVWNYEAGSRLSFFDRKLLIDTTAFYIDWSDIQLRLARPDNRNYVANAGSARNIGLENSITWRPTSAFEAQANVTYLSAELSKTLALGNGVVYPKGTRVPGASRWTTSETLTYRFDAPNAPYVTATHQYLSGATNDFDPTLRIGNYSLFVLRAGMEFGRLNAQAFATNLFDKRGVTGANYFGSQLTQFYVQPRTVGINLDWKL